MRTVAGGGGRGERNHPGRKKGAHWSAKAESAHPLGLFEFTAKEDYQICDGGNHCKDNAVLEE